MDDLRFNKIAGAVLATGLMFMGISTIAGMLYSPHGEAEELAYGNDIWKAYKEGSTTTVEEEKPLPFPQPYWVEAMSMSKGETVFKKCAACHNVDQGGAHGTGPALYGIVGSVAGQQPGFNYSSAMAESAITWDFEALDAYLARPRAYVPGTAMTFVGLKKPEDRAAIIEYMRMNADAPMAKPEPVIMLDEEPTETETVATPADDMVIVETPEPVEEN